MIYTEVIAKLVPQTHTRLWIATADIKDMYVEHNGTMVPFLKILAELIGQRCGDPSHPRQGTRTAIPGRL